MENQKHILIIDDNKDTVSLLQDFLSENGFSLAVAHTGSEGLQKVIDRRPDLILLDLYLPDMMGSDICMQLRNNNSTRDIPIILCTAHQVSITEKVKSFRAGIDDYLIRPFELAELLARMNAVLRRSQIKPKAELLADLQSMLPKPKPEMSIGSTPPPKTSGDRPAVVRPVIKPTGSASPKETQPLQILRRFWQILNHPSDVFVSKPRYSHDFFLAIIFVISTPIVASLAKIVDPIGGFDAWIGSLSLGIVTNLIMWSATAGLVHMSLPFLGMNLSMRRSLSIAGLAWAPRLLGAIFLSVYALLTLVGVAVQPDHFTSGLNLLLNVDASEWLAVVGNIGIFDFWAAWITLAAVWIVVKSEKKWTPVSLLIGLTCLLFGALTNY